MKKKGLIEDRKKRGLREKRKKRRWRREEGVSGGKGIYRVARTKHGGTKKGKGCGGGGICKDPLSLIVPAFRSGD